MRIPGLKTTKQSLRWLRSRFVDGGLILGYHRIAEVAYDPFLTCVTPKHFAEHLEVLRRYGRPISLHEFARARENGRIPRKAIVLTFDDGYSDNLYNAKPLLGCYEMPATVFIATGYMGREYWWDELAKVLLSGKTLPTRLRLSINGDTYEWTVDGDLLNDPKGEATSKRQGLLLSLYELLLPLSMEEREKVIPQLAAWAGAGSRSDQMDRAMTPDEVTQLVAGELIDVGAHTVTHPVLATLPLAAQQVEIQQSKSCLEELLGQPLTSFSYPNGSLAEGTLAVVRNCGFVCACGSHNGVASTNSNPLNLPRFWVPNCDGPTFSRWLHTWL